MGKFTFFVILSSLSQNFILKNQLNELEENTDFEEFLQRLPEIVLNLHELIEKGLIEAENTSYREEIKKIMELTLHELIIENKKALKIRLFEGLEVQNFDKN